MVGVGAGGMYKPRLGRGKGCMDLNRAKRPGS